ncbi:membrane-associated progesterone receptor component 1 isoform X2 [Drosophila bipectinata]|uniref:membrane-associated progesterone receptor component 1 isoform X2 n=1 Tax=Drosophila bipectinata TaxID=42026 RepID=UPI0038B26F66
MYMDPKISDDSVSKDGESSIISNLLSEILSSPMNITLLAIICFLVYKIVRDRTEVPSAILPKTKELQLPKLRRDFTIKELRQFDGNQPDGRVLVAVNGNVYDVSKGKRFYGPGGPYATFAGRDASRNLATFSVVSNDKDDYDDLSDLSAVEMDSVREWEMQFREKYELVGKLLRKGEHPTIYDEDDDDENINNEEISGTQNFINEENDSLRNRQSEIFNSKLSKDNKKNNFAGDTTLKSTQKTFTNC